MIAGGSGLTPCLQTAEELLSLPNDNTQVTLIFCNRSPKDIYLKDHLDSLAANSNGRFKVHYCVDKADADWNGLTGYVTADMIKEHLPAPDGAYSCIMVCGPPPMYDALCGPKQPQEGKPPAQGPILGVLKDLGYTSEGVFKF